VTGSAGGAVGGAPGTGGGALGKGGVAPGTGGVAHAGLPGSALSPPRPHEAETCPCSACGGRDNSLVLLRYKLLFLCTFDDFDNT
jgi:hypothetical protein